MDRKSPKAYSHYIENENEALPATAIHRHAQAGYHTTNPGEKLCPGITIDFDLSDPFFTEYKPGEYRPLHDPHLKHFLNKKSVRRCLMKNNLITKDGEVRCTLQEYNRFQRNLKHYFKTQKRIAIALEKKFYVDPRKILRKKWKNAMLQKRIQHNVKIAEARARHTEFMMKRRKHILNRIVQKDKQMTELINKVRMEREVVADQAQMEQKRRELLKIRLDSCELIRRCTILQRIRQKERIVAQKQLLEKQKKLKEFTNRNLEWHKERMQAKDDEMVKFLDQNNLRKAARKRSIQARTTHSEQNKNIKAEMQKSVFENHQRIEDTHLEEAKAWEKKVENNRAKAANSWRAKMHCMQTIAEGRMADIERRKLDRKRNALERKKTQIQDNLDHLERMNVTVLGTTGYGSHELANIHRDNSKIRFSAYYDPGRDTIDPCRTTQFHAYFKPLHVVHAKYQRDKEPKLPPLKQDKKVESLQIHKVPTPPSQDDLPAGLLLETLLSELICNELEDVVSETVAEETETMVGGLIESLLDTVVGEEAARASSSILDSVLDNVFTIVDSDEVRTTKIVSNFSLFSDVTEQETYTEYSSEQSFDFHYLVEDVVKKIMSCFEGKHGEVYDGQTSTTDCSERDGEEIITEIIVRLIGTVQAFTKNSDTQSAESSAHEILTPSRSSSRESLKDLHKRAQFLLNHALDVAKVKLKLRGYSYLTWNILEDCLKKARDKLLNENAHRVCGYSDVELVEWIMEEAKLFLQGATTLLYEMLHGHTAAGKSMSAENQQIVEDCYLDQLEKSDISIQHSDIDSLLAESAQQGDIAKFAVMLAKKTIDEAMHSIPKTSSIMLCEALRDGNFDRAGSILSAKAVRVGYEQLILDPSCPSELKLRDAVLSGDTVKAGTILANRAIQQAMNIVDVEDRIEHDIGSMVLKQALSESDSSAEIGQSLREAVEYLKNPVAEVTLEQALIHGDLEIAGSIMVENALEQGLLAFSQEETLRHDSSIALEHALEEGDLPVAGQVLLNRALREGMAELDVAPDLRSESSIVLESALEDGNLSCAGGIIVKRLLERGMSEVDEEVVAGILSSSSSMFLESSLRTGNLEAAAPILIQRALRTAQSDPEETSTDHTVVEEREDVEKTPPSGEEAPPACTKTPSDLILDESLEKGDLHTAADILLSRALKSPIKTPTGDMIDVELSPPDSIPTVVMETDSSAQETSAIGEEEFGAVILHQLTSPDLDIIPVKESDVIDQPDVIATVSLPELDQSTGNEQQLDPSFYDCVCFLEAPTQTESDENVFGRGQKFIMSVIDSVRAKLEQTFDKDASRGYTILKSLLQKNDFNGAAQALTKILIDELRIEIGENFDSRKQRTKVIALTSLLTFQSCLEVLRGSPGFEISAMSILINDFVRSTLNEIRRSSGNEAIVSLVIGKCIGVVANTKTMKVRTESSVDLFEACRAGDEETAGEVLAQKVIKKAECVVINDFDIGKFRSTNEILDEEPVDQQTPVLLSKYSVKSNRSKRKINTEGLPMPKPLSPSLSKTSNTYDPIREMLISEEREHMVNKMVSNSERLLKNSSQTSQQSVVNDSIDRLAENCSKELKRREVDELFEKNPSDQSLPLIESSGSVSGCVRKIQSKDHVYYINEGGIVKKRVKKKRSGSRRRISQDDVMITPPPPQSTSSNCGEPRAVSSESNLLIQPSPPTELPSSCSRKSLEHRRSSLKKKESSLQMLAVINSSYTNMVGKKGPSQSSDQVTVNSGHHRKPSIDDLLSDTDRELIQKLSTESINRDQ